MRWTETNPASRRGDRHVLAIGLLSDLHVHRHDQADAVKALIRYIRSQPPPDVLVCAGDISHRTGEIAAFLHQVDLCTQRYWIPGNHDVWVIDAESDSDSPEYRYSELFPCISRDLDWRYLPSGPVVLPGTGIAIVGTIGWFTGRGYSEWFDSPAGEKDDLLAQRFAQDLRTQIQSLPSSLRLIVVTHHLSHRLSPSYDPGKRDTWSGHLEKVLTEFSSRIIVVIHGHRHVRYPPTRIDEFYFAAHPFGYPHQHAHAEDGYTVVPVEI